MDNDRSTTKPRQSRWWWLAPWLGPLGLVLDTFGVTARLGYITVPSWMSWAPMTALSLAQINLTVIAWVLWPRTRKASRVRPHGRAGRDGRGSSVSRCALGLLAVLWPSGLVRRMRYSAALAERLVAYAVALQPAPFREHYQTMWLGDLDWLKTQDAPVLGWAVGMLSTAAMTRLALRARLAHTARQVRSLPQSPVAWLIGRHRPLGLGLLTAAGVFCAAAAGWSGVGQGPSRTQMLWALAASVLTGGAVTWQAWPRGPVPEERDPVEEPDRPARW
jgi:hypothetical protein